LIKTKHFFKFIFTYKLCPHLVFTAVEYLANKSSIYYSHIYKTISIHKVKVSKQYEKWSSDLMFARIARKKRMRKVDGRVREYFYAGVCMHLSPSIGRRQRGEECKVSKIYKLLSKEKSET
jgi:hypothetical protein